MKKRMFALLLASLVLCSVFPSMSVSAAEAVSAQGSVLSSSASLSSDVVQKGGSITVKVSSAVSPDCTYAVYYRLQGKEIWNCAQEYSASASCVIRPVYVGKYDVCIKTKDSKGHITKEYLQFESVDGLTLNAEVSKTEIVLGEAVRISASAQGGVGDRMFGVYWKKKTDAVWKKIIKDSKTCNLSFTPSEAGELELCIKVRDTYGTVKKTYTSLTVKDFQVKAAVMHAQITKGQKETIQASLTDSKTDCLFSYYYRKKGETAWRLIQKDTSAASVRVLPKESGSYEIYVKAKNSAGNVRKAYTEFSVSEMLTVSEKLSSDIIGEGAALKVTPSSTGGTGKVEYAVYYTSKASFASEKPVWKTALSYGQYGAAEIRPETAGEYVVVTKARDAAGSMAKTEYLTFTVTKQAALTVKGVFKSGSTVYSDTPAVIVISAEGGAGQYTYAAAVREKGTAGWKTISAFSEKTQVELKYADMGTYQLTGSDNFELKLSVKDASGKTADAIYSLTVTSRGKYELPVIPVR